MDCPVCKNAMITLEMQDVEVDFCEECGGIWLDSGELELLIGNEERAEGLLKSFKIADGCSEAARKCPICLKKMQKIAVGGGEKELLIDRCGRGDGLWFDRDELDEILARAELDKDNKIRELLSDMFGEEKPGEDASGRAKQ